MARSGPRGWPRILAIIGVVSLALVAMGSLAYMRASSELMGAAREKYGALRDVRTAALDDYLAAADETRYWAANSVLQGALATFRTAWGELGDDPKDALQRSFIEDNPYPVGQKDGLDFAKDGSSYGEAHASYHSWFRRFLTHRGYYDVFLIDPSGNLVYTVFKEMDYATNLVTGRYKDTGLATVFREALEASGHGAVSVADFEPYEPSHGDPAAFMASRVLDADGRLLGVLAFQLPSDRINEIMQVEAGMGTSGETYIVGSDLLMRSNSRFSEESTVLKTSVDTSAARKALEGESGVRVTADYRGVAVLSAYQPLEFDGLTWAVLAEIDEAEVLEPIARLRSYLLMSGLMILAASIAVIFIAALFVQGGEEGSVPTDVGDRWSF